MAVQDGGGEDPGEAIKARYLAKCVQRSSVVLHAVYGHIRCASTFDVVLGKVSRFSYQSLLYHFFFSGFGSFHYSLHLKVV